MSGAKLGVKFACEGTEVQTNSHGQTLLVTENRDAIIHFLCPSWLIANNTHFMFFN